MDIYENTFIHLVLLPLPPPFFFITSSTNAAECAAVTLSRHPHRLAGPHSCDNDDDGKEEEEAAVVTSAKLGMGRRGSGTSPFDGADDGDDDDEDDGS